MRYEVSSSIRFTSESVRGSDIADRLRLVDVDVHNKGDLVSSRAGSATRYSKSIVVMTSQLDVNASISDHINGLLAGLDPIKPEIERLRPDCSLEIWVKVSFEEGQLGFDIDPKTLRRLADFEVELVFDIYGG